MTQNILVWVGSSRGTPEDRESEIFLRSGVFVGTRIEEYTFCTETTNVIWRNTFLFNLSTSKKRVTLILWQQTRVLQNLTRSYGMVLCPNDLVQLIPVIDDWRVTLSHHPTTKHLVSVSSLSLCLSLTLTFSFTLSLLLNVCVCVHRYVCNMYSLYMCVYVYIHYTHTHSPTHSLTHSLVSFPLCLLLDVCVCA